MPKKFEPGPGLRFLDNAIASVVIIISIFVVVGIIRERFPDFTVEGFFMSDAWGFLLYIPILFGVYLVWKKFQKGAAIKAAGPTYTKQEPYEDGPMKVDISFQEIPAKDATHRLYGGDHWWRMHFDIWFSKNDWKLYERSGLMEQELFSYPDLAHSDGHSANTMSYTGHQLKYMPAYRDFPNMVDAEEAKEKLIRSLHIIRTRVDDMKSSKGGPPRERIEI